MTITITWEDTEKTILRQTFAPGWTWEEYESAIDSLFETIHNRERTVDIIAELKGSPKTSTEDFDHLRYTLRAAPSNIGMVAVVGCGYAIATMFSLLYKLYRTDDRRILIVESVEEAHMSIARARATRKRRTTGSYKVVNGGTLHPKSD